MQNETKNCQNCKNSFVVESEDFDFYKKMAVPPPTWCPECRMMRRLSLWNERFFFKKIEKRTGKEILSYYPPDAPVEIYERDYWWSDAWDPLSYGREIDWSRPFLAQVHELQLAVPWPSRAIIRSVNSDYSNNAADLKNCYLCFNADQSEDCMYGTGMLKMKACIDFYRSSSCELSYELDACVNCYQCSFVSLCTGCRSVWLSYNCDDCSDCFGCVNLRHKQYHIFNEPYSKEEYFAKLKEMNVESFAGLTAARKKFAEFSLKFPRKYIHGMQNTNVTGDYMRNSKNCKYCFAGANCENVKYSQSMLMGVKDSYDYTNWGNKAELTYETHAAGEDVQRMKFTNECWGGCNDIEYSMICTGSQYVFGSLMLRKKQYCILNKQYSKEEYEALIPKIKKHMDEMPYVDARGLIYKYGEFFPPEFSIFAVNESAIPDYMDMTKEQALAQGLKWRDPNPKEYQVTMQAADLPDAITAAPADITKAIIACAECKRGYRILPAELQFLQRFGIPLPRMCPNCRMSARIKARNIPKWYTRDCQCAGRHDSRVIYKNIATHAHTDEACKTAFLTAYSPEKPEIIYCEDCYQAEMV